MTDKIKRNIGAFIVSGMLIGFGYVMGRITNNTQVESEEDDGPKLQPTKIETAKYGIENGVHEPFNTRFYWRTKDDGGNRAGHFLTVESCENLKTEDARAIEDMVLKYQTAKAAASEITSFLINTGYEITGINSYDC